MTLARLGTAVAMAIAAVALVSSTPASAVMTENRIGCAGSADITGENGKEYHASSNDVSVAVPREGTARWEGSIATTTHNHSGQVTLAVGPINVQLGEWGPSKNANDENSARGVTEIPTVLKYVVPGEYVVSGFHQGDEGRCAGKVSVAVDVAPLSTPTGIAILVLTAVSAAGLVLSARPKGA